MTMKKIREAVTPSEQMIKDFKVATLAFGLCIGSVLAVDKMNIQRPARAEIEIDCAGRPIVQSAKSTGTDTNSAIWRSLLDFQNYAPNYDGAEENINSNSVGPNTAHKDMREMAKILYAEAANQPEEARRLVIRTMLNRLRSPEYPNNSNDMLYNSNAFSCTFSETNGNWKQVTGKRKMNTYDKKVLEDCTEDTRYMIYGGRVGVQDENRIIAYHDSSIAKPKDSYWKGLEKTATIGDLTFYSPKE